MKPFVSALVQPIAKWLPQGVGYKYNGNATGLTKGERLAMVMKKKVWAFSILCFARWQSVRILFLVPPYSKSWVSILTVLNYSEAIYPRPGLKQHRGLSNRL
jgi:hypothetical protein